MNEEDKRVIRTRTQLADALVDLNRDEEYEAITVQQIADKAGVSHRTFYRHYESKDDLLRDVLRTTMTDLRRVMPSPTPAELADPNIEEIARGKARKLYEFVAENSDIFRLLLQSGEAALNPIQALAAQQTENYFKDFSLENVPYRLVAHHMIFSSFSLIHWWLDNDMAYTPQQMGDYTARLIMLPIQRIITETVDSD